jgi:hypothetical protein
MGMKHIEVIVPNGSLELGIYRFLYLDREHTLRLIYYAKENRQTTRHKFKVVEFYDAYRRRESMLSASIIPETVAADALRQFTNGLTVTVWEK